MTKACKFKYSGRDVVVIYDHKDEMDILKRICASFSNPNVIIGVCKVVSTDNTFTIDHYNQNNENLN